MEHIETTLQDSKLEWQTPDLEVILTEKTELSTGFGADGGTYS